MKILFTGASSFTGYWLVKELTAAGHEVVMTFRTPPELYEGVRAARVEKVRSMGRCEFGCCFGDEHFMQLVEGEPGWDLLCHHAADVTNYRSPDFDVLAATANNTHNLRQVLSALTARGCRRALLTGSVFEGNEGAGSEGLPAFSPYGLAKEITARIFTHYAAVAGMHLGKFVIPNPFGPYEEPRFTAYLVRSWYEGKTPAVNTPAYVRDNIHVSLLAKAYVDFAQSLPATPGFRRLNPSGYAESQGAFARRFSAEMGRRLPVACGVELKKQTDFSEPRIRINTDPLDADRLGWDETRAWDEVADYCKAVFGGKSA
jgi:UDP-glucose 4-epimerase